MLMLYLKSDSSSKHPKISIFIPNKTKQEKNIGQSEKGFSQVGKKRWQRQVIVNIYSVDFPCDMSTVL